MRTIITPSSKNIVKIAMRFTNTNLIVLVILLFVTPSLWAQKPLNSSEEALVSEAKQELNKALTEETMAEDSRLKIIERSAKTLKEYGQPTAFPNGDIPLKANVAKRFRLSMGNNIYTNDLRAVFSNLILEDQLKILRKMEVEVAEQQIKLLIPGNGLFEFSKDAVQTVFDWNSVDGFTGGSIGEAKNMVQRFNKLATSKKLLAELDKLYDEENKRLNKYYSQLEAIDALQARLRTAYNNAANSVSTFAEFRQPGATSSTNSTQTSASNNNSIKANTPSGWTVTTNRPGSWEAKLSRKITEKTANCGPYTLDINLAATVSPLSGTMTTTEIDKKLRSWMSESGWYPEEAGIETLSINGFKGRLLTSTLKYKEGFGSPMAGYKDGKAHQFGYAILIADNGTKMLKISYSSFAGSCWDNKSANIAKKEALAGKNEAEQVMRSITVAGMENSAPTSTYTHYSPPTPPVSSVYPNPKNLGKDKLREVLLKALTNEPSTKDEIKYWTEREQQIKKNLGKPQPKVEPTTEVKPAAKTTSSTDMIVGDWSLVANGFAGILEIRYDGSALQGRVYFNSIGRWEPLQNLQFNSSTGKFTFLRPNAKQQHEGVLNGNTLTGTFTGNYKWSATKTGQPQTNSQPSTTTTTSTSSTTNTSWANKLVGDWSIISNTYAGRFEIRYDGTALQGRIYYDVTGRWEALENIQFDASTGKVSFYRPIPKQPFEGILSGSKINGTFSDKYKWSATKTAEATR